MAKRKRLTPPQALFMGDTQTDAQHAPSPQAGRAPIADVAGDASNAAALDEMVHVWRQAREEGRMVLTLSLDSIKADYLVRDRAILDVEGMETLKNSLRQRGQQTPIEVENLGQGRYGLISGWRRLQALRQLEQEKVPGGRDFDTVLALVRSPKHSADAYLAMVEENEIRLGLSFYERARIAVKATEAGVFETEQDALRGLYGAVPRAKRSKIKSFIRIVHALDGGFQYPEVISEKLGLALSKALEGEATLGSRLRGDLREARASGKITDAASELACIQAALVAPSPRAPALKSDSGKGENRSQSAKSDVKLRTNPDGSLTLFGPSVNVEFRARLMRWLSSAD
ncbi:ParB N-terminal domain-containing protein [uncultured Shimia sp.]|uniref:ParB/RepB/Spo0J family partition protein n=1 Tax=uncultured Shimia sp. TaxID=573152 RepID=UPI0026308311|nr:ParB N-terminal domain-containing protein [uncultured Shimia sp.]